MNSQGERVNFIWSIADLIRDTFKRSKYQDVILPFTVLRRIDCVLAPTKQQVLAKHNQLSGKLDKPDGQLRRASGFAFYNTSRFDFETLLQDAPNLAANLRAYINGFSYNMREVLEKFDFHNTITKLDEAGRLFLVMERFKKVDLHPDKVSNHDMGYIFEELIRKFNEALNENPGQHFTPREVISLMVNLLLADDFDGLAKERIIRTVYDPCCGSGGMLTSAKERIREINPNADVHLFGQEVNPETFAVCKSDLYMSSKDGADAENIKYGSTLSNDQHHDRRFDYLLANPPYGKDWKGDQQAVEQEAAIPTGRFSAGTPRISDGQLLFLQHMLSRMKAESDGGSRVAIVMNGSPLFTGDAGSGESEIRRWILENDWLEAIIALPEQLFYNTGIATYIWVLTNRKPEERRGLVQLIDASSFWVQMRKSLGAKRREISSAHIEKITQLYLHPAPGEHSQIFKTTDFGYRKITVERPLRLNFQVNKERLTRLEADPTFIKLTAPASSSKKMSAKNQPALLTVGSVNGQDMQTAVRHMLESMPSALFRSRDEFEVALEQAAKQASLTPSPPLRKVILSALSERDETAEICRDSKGRPEADPELRDYENVPLAEDINAYFKREVLPYVSDAWINTAVTDEKDGKVGKVGYEINFNRYFYKYQPPRQLSEIEADIKAIERDILEMLKEVAQ